MNACIRSEYLTVRRYCWPRAHALLTALNRPYDAHAAGELMRLNLDPEQRDLLEQNLPRGAVVRLTAAPAFERAFGARL